MQKLNNKYKEKDYIEELSKYVDSTYGEHYMEDENVQFMDLVMADPREGRGFLKYNASKYIQRYGKKEGFNRKDLLKAMHYLLLLLYKVEKDNTKEKIENNETI